jgi:hypothetical protein
MYVCGITASGDSLLAFLVAATQHFRLSKLGIAHPLHKTAGITVGMTVAGGRNLMSSHNVTDTKIHFQGLDYKQAEVLPEPEDYMFLGLAQVA